MGDFLFAELKYLNPLLAEFLRLMRRENVEAVIAAYAGLDAVILDPLDAKAISFIKVADMLTGKDPLCRGYIRAHRKGIIVD